MANFSDLPEGLAEEILCRVPASKLKKVRSTCKTWNHLFDKMSFARNHFDKAPKEFLALMLTKDNMLCPMSIDLHRDVPTVEVKNKMLCQMIIDIHGDDPTAEGNDYMFCPLSINLHEDAPTDEVKEEFILFDLDANLSYRFNISNPFISRVFHCDGLLLCTSSDESRIRVWNPCTSENKWIKAGNQGVNDRTFVLGYSQDDKSCGKSYKILSYFSGSSKNDPEIYEFSSDTWRKLGHEIAQGWSLSYSGNCVSLKGDTYVFATNETPEHINLYLLRFDFASEKFVPVLLPSNLPSYVATSVSVVGEEKLAVLLKYDDDSMTDIWLTNTIDETKAVSWSKILTLDLNDMDIQISHATTFLLDEENKAVVLCETWAVEEDDQTVTRDLIYIIKEDNDVTPVDLGVDPMDSCYPMILNYVPSLVRIEEAGGNKRKRGE